MRILAVNAGSSSVKLSVVGDDDAVLASGGSTGGVDADQVLREFVRSCGPVDAVAHRIVHGGPHLIAPAVVDDAVRRQLDDAAELAPLHSALALRLLDLARELLDVPHVVCLDTAFHANMPPAATTYAIPPRWRELGVRRYGFHGLSFAWASRRAAELLDRPLESLQLLVAHVGSGVSVCAIRGGVSVDTSMGFTPLEGAVMATRSGSVDPGALMWLQQTQDVAVAAMNATLETSSGLLALCGTGDMREIERRAAAGDEQACVALDVYVHRLATALGGVATSLHHLDALVFTGGVGEHSQTVRARVCQRMSAVDVPAIDQADGHSGADQVVATGSGHPAVVVITAREDAEMARLTRAVIG